MVNLLELDNVSKYFGYGVMGLMKFPALDNVSLSIIGETSEILTIVGESGCGKSTLAKVILRILKPSIGIAKYKGKDLWKLKRYEIKQFIRDVQPIFQDPMDSFNPYEPVGDYLISVATSLLKLDKVEAIENIEKTLEFVGLTFDKIRGKRPHEFSGGELQRISVARAILANPKLLVADEPVSMIDASLRVNILNLLRKIKDNMKTSIIYITHDIATANYIGNRIYVMYRGCVIEEGYIDLVIKEPLHPYTKVLLKSLPDYRRGKEWFKTSLPQADRTIVEVQEMLFKGCKYTFYCPYKTFECYKRPPMIEASKGHKVACWMYGQSHQTSIM